MMRWFLMVGVLIAAPLAVLGQEGDWLQWRGPTGNNHAAPGQNVPAEWSESENIAWKTPVPGEGHSSPIVVGQNVYLTTTDRSAGAQGLLGFDRRTGKEILRVAIHQGELPGRIHPKNTHATPTVASDGERLYVVFHTNGAIKASAHELDGTEVWKRTVARFQPRRYQYGYGASPILYQDMLIVAAEYDGPDSGLYALDLATGRTAWSRKRLVNVTYSSPIVANVAGRDQLLISGSQRISSYDPASGEPLWSAPATTDATCGTAVWNGEIVFASGGYPKGGTFAVRADGSGEVLWSNTVKCYEQSLLVVDDHLYAFDDNGIAYCWRVKDGELMWRERLGGNVSASPVYADGRIYASNESGTTFVFSPNPQEFTLLAKNQLGSESFATPTIAGGQIFLRHASGSGAGRQEVLYCVSQ